MNTQVLMTLNDAVVSNAAATFILSRHNATDVHGVMTFIASARNKGLCDLNIAKCIEVVTKHGNVSVARIMKTLAGAPAPATSSTIPGGISYSIKTLTTIAA